MSVRNEGVRVRGVSVGVGEIEQALRWEGV